MYRNTIHVETMDRNSAERDRDAASVHLRDLRQRQHAEEAAHVLQQQPDGAPVRFLAGEFARREAGVDEVLLDDRAHDLRMEVADAPESDDARAADDQAEPGAAGPYGMGQQPAIGAELDSARGSFVACRDPLRRLLEMAQQRHAQQRRQCADQEHRLPMREPERQQLPRGERPEQHADQRRREISPGRQRLQQPKRRRAAAVGQRIGDERDRKAEDAADPEAGGEAVDAKIDEAGGERAEPRAERVQQDADRQHPRAAVTIAERAEDQAADGPRDQEHGRRVRAVFQCELRVGDQVLHGGVARQVEDLQVEAIERPGKRSAGEDEPLFASQALPPAWSVHVVYRC